MTGALRLALALVLAGAPKLALADDASTSADLRVRQLPVRMKMPARPRAALKQEPKRVAQQGPGPTPQDPYAKSSLTEFSPLPTSARDLKERVTFKLRAGIELEGAGTSGETLRGGASLPEGFATSRPWIVGDAVVGARDILLPSLGAYFLSTFQLDASDSLGTRTAFARPYDASEYPIAIKAGYAEWGRDDRRPNQKLWLRGGRQFRLDGGQLFAYFDGGTVGYRDRGIEVSAFAGQRVTLYIDTPRGLLYGTTASIDLKKARDIPARIAVDYMGLSIDGISRDPADPDGVEGQTRQLLAVTGSYEVSKKAKVYARARLVDASEDGFALGRVGARLHAQPSRSLILIVDAERRQGGDLAYDLASPSAVDVVSVARQLGVGLSAPINATTLGAQVDYRKKNTELLLFGRAELPEAAGEVRHVDQLGWFEGGAAVAGAPLGTRRGGIYTTAQYKIREYRKDATPMTEGVGSPFGDSSTSGLDRMHELAVDGTIRSLGRGARRWRFAIGAFYRIYDFSSPYAAVTDEGRGGGRADVQYWFGKDLRLDLAAELAEPSPVLARELGVMSSVRAAMEARW